MAIVKMNKISLIGLESEKERILENLMKLGVVEITDSKEKMASDDWKELVDVDGDNERVSSSILRLTECRPLLTIWTNSTNAKSLSFQPNEISASAT
ncbi:hypothetical protein [Acetivibrio straminisolvens]|uniref:hypothetical protein n=1 Tax=Acetivibrio straminisolvens TaxID=253314 RepID=UPI001FB0F64A|nr:hypothetical protein [Acetivibrio straminisolvens]